MQNHLKSAIAAAVLAVAFGAGHAAAAQPAGGEKAQVLSGGVGEGERAKLEQEAHGYNLKIVFTLTTGNYLSEVPFQVLRAGKTVVEHTAQGPWAYVKLPAGRYTVKATFEDQTQTKTVDVPKSGQKRLAFAWRATQRVADQPPPSR
jgi:hypothetical protein